jgi:capsular exopolysaccharide synthesis family protein
MAEADMNLSPALSERHTVHILSSPEARQVFMGIYDNILLTANGTRQRSILICSANRGEGASTVALGLAMAAAEVWNQPVLLIDGNFSHPQACEAFGLADIHGLGDILAGHQDLPGLVRDTAIPHLQVLGAGVPPLNHISLLEAPAFSNLLDRFTATYPLIIIDGPSINCCPESVQYAPQVDRVLLVVKSGITRVPVVSAALVRLAAGGCEHVDLILNQRVFPIPAWIYRRL